MSFSPNENNTDFTEGGSKISVEEKVKATIGEVFHRNLKELTGQTSFVKDLHAKSANILELIAMLEDEFDLELSFSQVMKNDTVGAAIQYVESRLRSK